MLHAWASTNLALLVVNVWPNSGTEVLKSGIVLSREGQIIFSISKDYNFNHISRPSYKYLIPDTTRLKFVVWTGPNHIPIKMQEP